MSQTIINIEICNPQEGVSESLEIELLSDNIYKALQSSLFDQSLTFDTVFETRKNKDGKHEVIKILNVSDYITKRFLLMPEFKESDYKMLGDEVVKIGGFWQVDLNKFVIINIPKGQGTYI